MDHEVVWVLREEVPEQPGDYSHVLVSGSSYSILDSHDFMVPIEQFLRDAAAAEVPMMGVCYGAQLVARAFLGPSHVRRIAAENEVGWLPVEVTDEAGGWFAGLPRPFYAWHSHNDEVHDLPDGWRVLARSELCDVQAYDQPELRIFGVQFHAEMDLEAGNATFRRERPELEAEGVDVDRLLATARDDGAHRLFHTFLERSAADWKALS
jgi:GMP synthase (glutamine-hydrolysing)